LVHEPYTRALTFELKLSPSRSLSLSLARALSLSLARSLSLSLGLSLSSLALDYLITYLGQELSANAKIEKDTGKAYVTGAFEVYTHTHTHTHTHKIEKDTQHNTTHTHTHTGKAYGP
jgi:hypothetical protein